MIKLAIVGEAWGAEEAERNLPFIGPSGRLLRGLCAQAGVRFEDAFVTNVFNLRPQPTNDIKNLCGGKDEALANYPALSSGKYIRSCYASELSRLHNDLERLRPNLILALGGTPLWALVGKGTSRKAPSIKATRGACIASPFGKVLPTYHPASLFRDWTLRPILFSDLQKVPEEMEFPEVRRPRREVWIDPSEADIDEFIQRYILPAMDLSIDIETFDKYITSIAFAPTPEVSLCIPFIRTNRQSYWPDVATELRVWEKVRYICSLNKNIVGQNFLYDMHRLWRTYGITVPHLRNDTMLLHHALFIELEKGLGFLGSVYTSEARWKMMRVKDTLKKEDT